MTDMEHFKEKVEAMGVKYGHLAKALGITQQAFRLKVRNKSEFKVSEVMKLAEILNLNPQEQNEIFFAKN